MATLSTQKSLKTRIEGLIHDIDVKLFNKNNIASATKSLQDNKFVLNSLYLKLLDAESKNILLSENETENMIMQISSIDKKINGLQSDFARQMFFRTILVVGLIVVGYRYFKKGKASE